MCEELDLSGTVKENIFVYEKSARRWLGGHVWLRTSEFLQVLF
jgi:hypothetical protein